MKSAKRLTAVFIAAGLAIWILDAAVDAYFFYDGTFLDMLLQSVPNQEILNRTVTLLCIALSGVIIIQYVNRMVQGERAMRHLAAIVENSDNAILTTDIGGIVHSWNHGAEKMYGYPAEQAIGSRVTFIYPPDREHEFHYFVEQVLRDGKVVGFETVRIRRDGQNVYISLDISLISGNHNEPLWVSVIARDITPRKMIELKLQKLQREQERFLRHEFRNLFVPIKGYAELLLMGVNGDLTPAQNHCVDRISQSVDRAISLFDYIKKLQDIEGGQWELDLSPCSVREIIEQVIADLSMMAEENGVVIERRFEGEDAPGRFDMNLMPGVFMNLIKNAIEHVRALEDPREKVVRIVQWNEGSRSVVTINNRGRVLSPERVAAFFEKFNTDRSEKADGTGLGTTYAYLVTRAHGGRIGVDSNKRDGTTVAITFECP